MLQFKPDWAEASERLEAWWDGEIIDRVVIQVTAPRDNLAAAPEWDIWSPPHFRSDPGYVVEGFEAYCQQTYFGGEAFPNLWINLGPGIMAAYIGARPKFHPRTTWFETPKEWDEIEEIVLDPDNEWWKKTCELTSVAVERGQGRFFTGLTDIGGNLDIAASLRGSQRLCLDLIDCPDKVLRFSEKINKLWFRYYSALYDIMQPRMPGTSAWMGIWSPLRWYPLQCDFSAMISPQMFEQFVLPYLKEQCRWLDHAIYHWDGPGQIPHLDMLLETGELNGIQWVPGAGAEPTGSHRWFPYYRKILEHGKNLVLLVEPEDVEALIRELGPQGLLLQTTCDTETEARLLLERVSDLGTG